MLELGAGHRRRVEGFKKQRAIPRLGKESVGEAVKARACGSAAARRKAGKEYQSAQLSLSQRAALMPMAISCRAA